MYKLGTFPWYKSKLHYIANKMSLKNKTLNVLILSLTFYCHLGMLLVRIQFNRGILENSKSSTTCTANVKAKKILIQSDLHKSGMFSSLFCWANMERETCKFLTFLHHMFWQLMQRYTGQLELVPYKTLRGQLTLSKSSWFSYLN